MLIVFILLLTLSQLCVLAVNPMPDGGRRSQTAPHLVPQRGKIIKQLHTLRRLQIGTDNALCSKTTLLRCGVEPIIFPRQLEQKKGALLNQVIEFVSLRSKVSKEPSHVWMIVCLLVS